MHRDFNFITTIIWCFPVGFGFLGWILFFAGLVGFFSSFGLSVTLLAGVPGLYLLYKDQLCSYKIPNFPRLNARLIFPLVLLAASILFDVLEALLPPADADSLAYHFALPKFFLQNEELVFVPRAADGAIPLLTQLTFLPVLGLGGELSMTLWAGLTGLATAGFFYLVLQFL